MDNNYIGDVKIAVGTIVKIPLKKIDGRLNEFQRELHSELKEALSTVLCDYVPQQYWQNLEMRIVVTYDKPDDKEILNVEHQN